MRDYTKKDDRDFNISLMAGLFAALIVAIFEFLRSSLKIVGADNPLIELLLSMMILILIGSLLIIQWNRWNKNQRKR